MISNSSPLIIFGKLNEFEILKKVFNKIEITKSVYEEVVERGMKSNKSESFIIKDWIEKGFVSVQSLSASGQEKSIFLRETYVSLDEGESDTIALAIQKNQKNLLIDEKAARKVAEIYRLFPIGSLGVLLLAYKKKILNEQELKKIVSTLILGDFRISADILNEFWNLFQRMRKEKKK